MESEKVKEIKKALQETIDGKLSTEYLTVCEISCCPRLDIDKLFSDILTLINELESENERLKILLAQANAGIVNCSGCKLVELNAVKEFAERLKEKFKGQGILFYDKAKDCHYYRSIGKEIDELLEEYEK